MSYDGSERSRSKTLQWMATGETIITKMGEDKYEVFIDSEYGEVEFVVTQFELNHLYLALEGRE